MSALRPFHPHLRPALLLAALAAAGCGATRPPLPSVKPWEIGTEAVLHPPAAIPVVQPRLPEPVRLPEQVDPRLREKVTLRSDSTDLRSLLLGLSKQTGLNIIVDDDVKGTVSAYFNDVEVLEALRQILGPKDMDLELRDNFVRVYKKGLETRVYRLHYLRSARKGESLFTMLDRSSAMTQAGGGQSGGGDGGLGLLTGSGAAGGAGGQQQGGQQGGPGGGSLTTISSDFTVSFWEDLGAELQSLIFPDAKPDELTKLDRRAAGISISDTRGRSLVMNSLSGSVVVRAHRSVLDSVGQYLKMVEDTVQRQVVIDIRILEVALANSNMFGVQTKNLPLLPSDILSGIPFIGDAAPRVITPLGFKDLADPFKTPPDPVPPAAAEPPLTGSLLPEAGDTFYGIHFGNDDKTGFKALISALGKLGDVHTVSAPRVSALHNQKAVVKVVRDRVFYMQKAGSTALSAGGSVTQQSEFVPVVVPEGVVVDVTPLIGDDGTVTLEIHPSFSVIFNEKSAPQGQGSQPEVERRELQTTVRVDGEQTVVLGGLVTQRTVRKESGVPWLKDIPYLGALFRRTEDSHENAELIMLLTPRVQGPKLTREYLNGMRKLSGAEALPVPDQEAAPSGR